MAQQPAGGGVACAVLGEQHERRAVVEADLRADDELCPFPCRGRSLFPSCEKKKQLLWAEWLRENVLEAVAHRHVVLTMLLGDLSGEYLRRKLGADTRPGIVVSKRV